jgi:predicted DNA-binding WGR domain protein
MAYDVFISFKNSGKDGTTTPDAVAARKVYASLKSQGIRTFFSEESLAEEGRGHFGRAIEKALESARVLILVASCREHIESQWVEVEWDSFAQDILSGNKKGELFIYNCGALKPRDLPLFLRRQQMFPEAGLDKLIQFVSNAIRSTPRLDSYIQLTLHCSQPEKHEDKIYLLTLQPGAAAGSFNVTAHWGARSAKRLNSQVKAVNASAEQAKTEIEKAQQEKLRAGYSPADHANLLSDEARLFLSASLGLHEEPPTGVDVPNAKAPKAIATEPAKAAKHQAATPTLKTALQSKMASSAQALLPAEDTLREEALPKTVCISGKLPSGKKKADYLAPLHAAGYVLVDAVVKGLTYLVIADPDSVSSKSEKAKKMGVKLISEAQLAKLVR